MFYFTYSNEQIELFYSKRERSFDSPVITWRLNNNSFDVIDMIDETSDTTYRLPSTFLYVYNNIDYTNIVYVHSLLSLIQAKQYDYDTKRAVYIHPDMMKHNRYEILTIKETLNAFIIVDCDAHNFHKQQVMKEHIHNNNKLSPSEKIACFEWLLQGGHYEDLRSTIVKTTTLKETIENKLREVIV